MTTSLHVHSLATRWAPLYAAACARMARVFTLCTPRRQALLGLAMLAVLLWPSMRHALEASMARHMLAQFPLLLCSGALLAQGLPGFARAAVSRWNAHGISGLVGATLVLAVLMVPRALDLALVDPWVEACKCAALVLSGAALRLSWRAAGLVVQAFFLGNVLPMTAVVGQLYIDSPVRVCNAYLLDDQALLGGWLVRAAIAIATLWLVQVACAMARREAVHAPPLPPSGRG